MTNEHDSLRNAQEANTIRNAQAANALQDTQDVSVSQDAPDAIASQDAPDASASQDASAALHPLVSAPVSDRDIALMAARVANEKKAFDIVLQHVEELTGEAAYFVTMTARNDRQVKALCNAIEKELRDAKIHVLHRETTRDSSWELLDYGGVVVHVFYTTRDYYRLEELWQQAPVVDLASEVGFEGLEYTPRIEEFLAGCTRDA